MIITSLNAGNWVKIAIEGVHSVIRSNQYGTKFFTLYGNTFPIRNELSQLGLKFFKPNGTWSIPVNAINDAVKNGLMGLGIDIGPLDVAPMVDVPPEKTPVQEVAKPEAEKSIVDKELDKMKDGVAMAMKQDGSERVKGLLGFIDRMIERVAEMTDEAAKSDFIKNFMAFAAKFHNYSFGNQILIWVQKPNSTYIRGAKQWMEMGREVANWDNKISIIAPMFKKIDYSHESLAGKTPEEIDAMPKGRVYFNAVSVYDISDTKPIENWGKKEGKTPFEPPKLKSGPNESVEEATILINSLIDWAKDNKIDVNFEKMGEDLGGYSAGGKIRVNDAFKGLNLFSTMVHECAHEILHWEEVKEGGKRRPAGKQEGRQSKEIDSETTAYIVLKHYGFESKDAPNYLALWKAKGEDVKARRSNISKAVEMIIEGIDSKVKANTTVEAKGKKTIKISKYQWELIGQKTGWMI